MGFICTSNWHVPVILIANCPWLFEEFHVILLGYTKYGGGGCCPAHFVVECVLFVCMPYTYTYARTWYMPCGVTIPSSPLSL